MKNNATELVNYSKATVWQCVRIIVSNIKSR